MTLRIGVLALQGAFQEHCAALQRQGVEAVEVRLPHQLQDLDGLILPGGESTAIANVAERWGMIEPLKKWVAVDKKPVWGTCAGMILLANRATGQKLGGQTLIGGLNVEVHRNYFGSQIQSFEVELPVPPTTAGQAQENSLPYRAVFIRAPAILNCGEDVEILSTVTAPPAGQPASAAKEVVVAAKQANIMATAFHPELTTDDRWHQFFLSMVQSSIH